MPPKNLKIKNSALDDRVRHAVPDGYDGWSWVHTYYLSMRNSYTGLKLGANTESSSLAAQMSRLSHSL